MTDTVGQLHATPSADEATYNEKRLNRRRMAGLFVGIALAVIVYLIFPSNAADMVNAAYPNDKNGPFNEEALRMTAAVAVLMGAWWMTEAIPLAATALVPLVIFPIALLRGADNLPVHGRVHPGARHAAVELAPPPGAECCSAGRHQAQAAHPRFHGGHGLSVHVGLQHRDRCGDAAHRHVRAEPHG